MREEIWTEKIFKDDAGYFLRITILYFLRKISSIDFYLKYIYLKNIKREGLIYIPKVNTRPRLLCGRRGRALE